VTASDQPHRRTVAAPVAFEGVGIHTGAPSRLEVRPAEADSGIRLSRMEDGRPPLEAHIRYADGPKSDRRTVLVGPEGQRFEQIEHVMAALAAHGVSDAEVVMQGPEPPFLGGGSLEYMRGLREGGFVDFKDRPWEPITLTRPVRVEADGAEMVAAPCQALHLSCFVEFPGTVVGSMGASLQVTADSFESGAAAARTFALKRDIEGLWAAGLARGGTLDNALVFDENGYANPSLHFPDEVARHKIVDLLGDLALIARPLRGHFWAWRAGHRAHIAFAKAIHEVTRQP
jgi:UDP-3-O-[3-hydroxymyristoyl] N-acetylglucosamine deacetylase